MQRRRTEAKKQRSRENGNTYWDHGFDTGEQGMMGCRFLDKDFIPVYNPDSEQTKKFSGRRDNRLYKTKSGIIINTDLNGSANIGRKAFPEQFTTDNCDILSRPVIIRHPDHCLS